MTSSNYYELTIRGPGDRTLWKEQRDLSGTGTGTGTGAGGGPAGPTAGRLTIDAASSFAIALRRWSRRLPALRVRLGDDVVARVPRGASTFETGADAWLRNEFGECRLTVETEDSEEADGESVGEIFALELAIAARPEVWADVRIMIRDLTEIHEGLATEALGRGRSRRAAESGGAEAAVSRLNARTLLEKLGGLRDRMTTAIGRIAEQPSRALHWSQRLARYRGGDRVNASAAARAARDPATRLSADGRALRLGPLPVRHPELTEDLPEHRHIARGLTRLADRSRALAEHCERSAALLEENQNRWGNRDPRRESVFDKRDRPRMEMLRELAAEARRLERDFRAPLRNHDFLSNAGPPRTPLGPTPAFLNRADYREVYACLLESRDPLGLLVDGDALEVTHRDLPTLYEYWCFLQTIRHLHRRFGVSGSVGSFSLVDEIYRPQLSPGQEFRFETESGARVVATYEPEFPKIFDARRRGAAYGASLTPKPLRPDIAIEVIRDDRPPSILVLDAKSTDNFTFAKFRDVADYSRQILDVRTNHQPVRQVFLLHRDRTRKPAANLPEYFEEKDPRSIPESTVVLGAAPCVPSETGPPPWLGEVIDRFLAIHAEPPRGGGD